MDIFSETRVTCVMNKCVDSSSWKVFALSLDIQLSGQLLIPFGSLFGPVSV